MALDHSALLELLEALNARDVEERIRTSAETIYQALIDAKLTAVIPHSARGALVGAVGAAQRVAAADVDHDGWDLELRIPKLRTGSFFPSLPEQRRPLLGWRTPDCPIRAPITPRDLTGVPFEGRRPVARSRR